MLESVGSDYWENISRSFSFPRRFGLDTRFFLLIRWSGLEIGALAI